ncbi:hypothetical protein DITRI_Ditri05aG0105800 [Diplodiscus trichospermus]
MTALPLDVSLLLRPPVRAVSQNVSFLFSHSTNPSWTPIPRAADKERGNKRKTHGHKSQTRKTTAYIFLFTLFCFVVDLSVLAWFIQLISVMVTTCQTCGDRGFSEALIYCDKCQAYAVHRYCLDKLPGTFEEHVFWFCVDCEPKVAESSTPKESLSAINFQLRLKKGSPVRKSKCKNDIKILKKNKRKYDSDSLEVQRKSVPLLLPPENHENDDMQTLLGVHGFGSDKEARYIEAKAPPNTCRAANGSYLVNINEEAESSLVAIDGNSTIIEHTNFSEPRLMGLDGVYFDEVAGCVKTKASLMDTSDQSCVSAQPIFQPIWRGNFRISDENFDVGVVAHLSSLACLKVCETAKCFPELLCLELLPRCDAWPKGFQKLGPSEKSIALYFFPNNARDGSIFYGLVCEMIRQDLGMRVGKQASNSITVVHDEEKNLWKSLTCDSHSLDSPLSNTVSVPVSLHSHASSVSLFTGLNFSDWCEQVKFHLGVLNLDLALQIEKPAAITKNSSDSDKSFHKAWERSNRLSLIFMRMTVVKNIKSTLPDTDSAKEYMKFVEEHSQIVQKPFATTLVDTLTNMKYNGSCTMHEHVNEMIAITTRLNSLGMLVDDGYLVHFVMNCLPPEYNSFRLTYNTMMGKRNVNELRDMLTQEETRLKNMKSRSVHFINCQEVGKKAKRRRSRKRKRSIELNKSSSQIHKNDKCYFCGRSGHFQRECLKRKACLTKKGIPDDPNHNLK